MPRPPASLHLQPHPVLPKAQGTARIFVPEEDSEAGTGIVTPRTAGPLRAQPGRLRLVLHRGTRLSGWRELSEWSRQRNPGDGAAAGIVRSSAICFLQEGRKRDIQGGLVVG